MTFTDGSAEAAYDAFASAYDDFTSGYRYERWTGRLLERAEQAGLRGNEAARRGLRHRLELPADAGPGVPRHRLRHLAADAGDRPLEDGGQGEAAGRRYAGAARPRPVRSGLGAERPPQLPALDAGTGGSPVRFPAQPGARGDRPVRHQHSGHLPHLLPPGDRGRRGGQADGLARTVDSPARSDPARSTRPGSRSRARRAQGTSIASGTSPKRRCWPRSMPRG